MRLALRDAAFEHSIPVSSLDAADAAAFDGRPPQCPVRRNLVNNHVQFEHDLAADWARFQKLKENASDTARWATYAENPLWNGALRMLGQFLLRRPSGSRTAWDDAFENVQAAQGGLPLADDILLDALFLDPATAFLEERADMLFANNANHLQRLLVRFGHVTTVSGVSPGNEGPLKDYGVYLEAKFRTPIVGRWPALVAFLSHHQQRIADTCSSAFVDALRTLAHDHAAHEVGRNAISLSERVRRACTGNGTRPSTQRHERGYLRRRQ